MRQFLGSVRLVFMGALAFQVDAAPARWVEGKNYVVLRPAQHTSVPAGKVEVLEVFSYGCPYCNMFQPVIEQLKHSLPANAQMAFLPASWSPAEDWPMFQRAYFAAQALGIAEKSHQAIYDAVWRTGELGIMDPSTHAPKRPLPSLEDAARSYGRIAGINPKDFLAAAHSFGVDVKVQAADKQVMAMQIPSTPCIVVNGKYRIIMDSVPSPGDVIELVKYLVAQESGH